MTKTILLADDSVTIRKVVELTLMDGDYKLISVGSGSEALSHLASEIDLVIADVHMPGVDGYEVCRVFKAEDPTTPVLLLVGTFELYDPREADAAGADDHLKKPFDSQDLLSRVQTLVAGSTASDRVGDSTEPVESLSVDESAEVGVGAASGESTASEEQAPPAVSAVEERVEEPGAGHSEPAEATDADDPSDGLQEEAEVDSGESVPVELSDETVDRIARRVIELLSEEAVREVAWDVIPDLAEVVIKERLSELEAQVE